jgi:hypothetical protein
LPNQEVADPEYHAGRLLLCALHGNKAHRWAGCRFGNRFGVGCVVLLTFDERLYIGRGDQTYLMPKSICRPQ